MYVEIYVRVQVKIGRPACMMRAIARDKNKM